ncbi:MAG: Asp-tRNA(Asn)/Glu-tRNA(Gln) amidotransferase subunit GatB [Candidatus Omnitrophica bacterium]|nr:Asp-tRNA(Asn)/Glu-tRNA(Gln) amidotransferase subunit GatB [Candidatus Omnitrophota bacterium]MBU2044253.1 Asp-tRNA(Asn)/Glu-tRNA(Gln) amidotransferase subunit GatB [Candidatus Omnitrophota bacterium]MBU2266074.1 Asp-tRNA(Asn)/Glu-tRNA(Gln) amidotransferase subunit GatB [Candidatus Omnitrophota bacterium]MBU2474070.1 Asp-tRNA(Asn)/Glu-tRNA(Gln) amidotransferase subunit GatB [Candidatus Omnitrophota bacterium]
MSEFETVIGLEVHVQLKTKSKIFCGCSVDSQSRPNTNICPVCCGYPGVLPVFNFQAFKLATRVCLAFNCKINPSIYFERKNYFYPDLPKNYQISQYQRPLGEKGSLKLLSGKPIGINRVHLEEDAGKLIHKDNYSLVDYNRTGTPLLEIVSEAEINSSQEAFEYLTYLKLTLQYIGISDCDMEKGSLRCDANISLRAKGSPKLGVKVEIKNMNSFKGVKAALEYEIKRQAVVLEKGEKVIQETRLWDQELSKTTPMRSKEKAHDYRYFPEPDLLDFSLPPGLVAEEKSSLGELPLDKRKRLLESYSLGEKETDVLIALRELSDFFETAVKRYAHPKEVLNWLIGPFLEQVNNLEGGFSAVRISAENFVKIVRYFSENKLNNLAAKKVLSLALETDQDVDEIINSHQLTQMSDQGELEKFIEEALSDNPKAVEEYLSGKSQAMQFLVGQVMKKTKGKANPKLAREMLERRLER